jgi:hypothetical protein
MAAGGAAVLGAAAMLLRRRQARGHSSSGYGTTMRRPSLNDYGGARSVELSTRIMSYDKI